MFEIKFMQSKWNDFKKYINENNKKQNLYNLEIKGLEDIIKMVKIGLNE
jgi:hypothetical protein